MTKLTKKQIINQLWEEGNLEYLLRGKQKDIKHYLKNNPNDVSTVLSSRRFGKCRSKNSTILTPNGVKTMEEIKVGDEVFGYNEFNQVEITKVVAKEMTGVKTVYDYVHGGRVLETATEDHVWLTFNIDTKEIKELSGKQINNNESIKIIKDMSMIEVANSVNHYITEGFCSIGVKLINPRKEETWDIKVANSTSLYLTGEGLVTHNSFILCSWAIEECIKKSRAVVKYACPTKEMVYKIIHPIIVKIIADAPEHLKPEWREKRQVWLFPNGSEIQIAGTDKGNIEFLRGGASELCICDEAGFMDDLDYAVNSVLAPTTDTTGGKIVLASTPNYKDPNHEFHVNFIYPLEERGELVRYTIYDSPMVTPEKIQKIINRYPKKETDPKFRCEYLCEVAVSLDEMVVGEFNSETEKDLVKIWERPDFCDFYTSVDPGFKHLTGVLFAYYDYSNSTLVIEDELAMNGSGLTTESLAINIKHKEKKNFYDKKYGLPIDPFLRVIDNNNLILVNDLQRLHDMLFIPTKKDNKEASINEMKIMFREKKIIINPRCVNLIYQLRNVKWNKSRTDFSLIKDSIDGNLKGGHADLVAALVYLVRNVVYTKNPYPDGYGVLTGHDIHNGYIQKKENNSIIDIIFNRKK